MIGILRDRPSPQLEEAPSVVSPRSWWQRDLPALATQLRRSVGRSAPSAPSAPDRSLWNSHPLNGSAAALRPPGLEVAL